MSILSYMTRMNNQYESPKTIPEQHIHHTFITRSDLIETDQADQVA